MRIALYSDLHLEMLSDSWQPPALNVDVVILAGDIGSHTQGIEWGAKTFLHSLAAPTVLYVAGNHEYYGADIHQLTHEMRATSDRVGVRFLENDTVVIGNIRFLGTTLWSNFKLYGSDAWTARSIAAATDSISDYRLIRKNDGFISVEDTIAIHEKAAA